MPRVAEDASERVSASATSTVRLAPGEGTDHDAVATQLRLTDAVIARVSVVSPGARRTVDVADADTRSLASSATLGIVGQHRREMHLP